jgi:hypothetical protein
LLELGISGDEVDAVAARIGVVGEEERQLHLRWYRSILRVAGEDIPNLTLDHGVLIGALTDAGICNEIAEALVDAGGGETVRRDAADDSPLRLLTHIGIDLVALDAELKNVGDAGLALAVARRSFVRWIESHGRRVSAVFAKSVSAEVAKISVRALEAPSELALSINPSAVDLLSPVVDLLRSAGLAVDPGRLAEEPVAELMRVGGFASVDLLDEQVLLLFHKEEQERVLRERAVQWRREIRLLAVLGRMGPAETRATVRTIDDAVGAVLPGALAVPSDLLDAVGELFIAHADLRDHLAEQLVDSLAGQDPDREQLLILAKGLGVVVERLPILARALEAPRRDQARAIKGRSERLSRQGVVPPEGLKPPPPRGTSKTGRKKVTAVKVGESHDRRKRELGDEGEQWALAAVIGQLIGLGTEDRDRAIDEVVELLARWFDGPPVDAALAHSDLARSRDLDEEELIDELTGLLHVSRHSDEFGFDLVGWLALAPEAEPQAICLEVKSSGSEGFNLSSAEWALAQRLHDADEGDRYGVLVVRRGKRGGLPASLDLLVDPVALVAAGQLRQEVDGYKVVYRSGSGVASLGSSSVS